MLQAAAAQVCRSPALELMLEPRSFRQAKACLDLPPDGLHFSEKLSCVVLIAAGGG